MGRIRSIKPQWRSDEKLKPLDDAARVLSVALITLADCYGNGEASVAILASETWVVDERDPGPVFAKTRRAIHSLWTAGFVTLYSVNSQNYFHICNWERHQRISKPSPPRVPGPERGETITFSNDCGIFPDSFRDNSELTPNKLRPDREGEGERDREGDRESPHRPPVGGARLSRGTKASRLLAEHGEVAARVWSRQEELRAAAIPGSRGLEPTPDRLTRIAERLADGNTEADCEAVLQAYAREAMVGDAKWFNGETNWRKANFDRALGSVGAERQTRGGLSPREVLAMAFDDEQPPVSEEPPDGEPTE